MSASGSARGGGKTRGVTERDGQGSKRGGQGSEIGGGWSESSRIFKTVNGKAGVENGIRPIGYGVSWDPVDGETMIGVSDLNYLTF